MSGTVNDFPDSMLGSALSMEQGLNVALENALDILTTLTGEESRELIGSTKYSGAKELLNMEEEMLRYLNDILREISLVLGIGGYNELKQHTSAETTKMSISRSV